MDFLDQLPRNIEENTLLVSFDVVSLYTSIPHDLGLEAINYWVINHGADLPRPFTTDFILKAIALILKENTFQFDDKNFKQIQGTAMGTKMAPSYATLVMGYLEKQLYARFLDIYGPSETEEFINTFKRFLDDCFLLWNKSKEALEELHQLLNNLHPKINFTMELNANKLPFLDVLVLKEDKHLYTDIYYKTTDTHQYLDYRSCHPRHTKRNIPYCLARRICIIVSRADIRDRRLDELKTFLKQQHYPERMIAKGIEKAKKLDVEELRRTSQKNPVTKKMLPLVITHNPNNPNITGRIKENLKFLETSEKMKPILDKTALIISRQQPKNLKKYLTQAKFSNIEQQPSITKCGEERCGTCPYLRTGNSITFKNGKTWQVRSIMTCKATNVVYAITCTTCGSFYIGQTKNLRKRVTLHRQQIHHEEYRHLTVSNHLIHCSKGTFNIAPIYQCRDSNRLLLESKEKNIIDILKPDLNK